MFTSPGETRRGDLPEEAQQQREGPSELPERSECALGVFVYNGPEESVDYFHVAQRLNETQGEFRGGGGAGLALNAMTQEKAHAVLHGADERPGRLWTFGNVRSVNLASAKKLEVIQLHAEGRDLDTILKALSETGVQPLYVESIQTNPGAMSFCSFRGTFGNVQPEQVAKTFLRIFVDNTTEKKPVQLEQEFGSVLREGPVIMSWSSIQEEGGLLCYRFSGKRNEFDEFFRPDLEGLKASRFFLHDRYPTQVSKPGVRNSQPRVQDDKVSMHNGDLENHAVIQERLRDPKINKYERLFYQTYGKPSHSGEPFRKLTFPNIAPVDSAVMVKVHTYLWDCCKRYGIDPLVISLFERPPSLAQIRAMPARERHFFSLARLAFPELSYQGSAATIIGTPEYIRITPDRTRVVWIAKDIDGNVYVASNAGAISNACHPSRILDIRPVEGGEILDIDLRSGEIVKQGMEFLLPPTHGEGDVSQSVFMPGVGFDQEHLGDVVEVDDNGNGEIKPFPGQGEENLKGNLTLSAIYGTFGFEFSDIERLVHYGNTGTYRAVGLGAAEPNGVFKRARYPSQLSSEHKAFIVSPGRDNRIEFSARTFLRNGEDQPIFLESPILIDSVSLRQTEEGRILLREIAKKHGTLSIDELQHARRISVTYAPDETLEHALRRIMAEAEAAAKEGIQNIILDDSVSGNRIPIPGSLACAAIHRHLQGITVFADLFGESVPENLRSRVNLLGNFHGLPNAEEVKECIMHGADAVAPSLAFDASLRIFGSDLSDAEVKAKRDELLQRGMNALAGLNEDLAIACGSSGFHDLNAMRGNAPGMEYELGIAGDINDFIGQLPGMHIGGVDLKTLDLILRSYLVQYGQKSQIELKELPDYRHGWERWNPQIIDIIEKMAHGGGNYRLDPRDYKNVPVVTLEDTVEVTGLEGFREFDDAELQGVDLRVLDYLAVMVAHMSIGAHNVETWVSILAALYELRHEIEAGEIPFLRKEESRILAGIGEGGIAAELRMFLAHIMGQYASGRFGIETDDGDIFDRQFLLKQGLLHTKDLKARFDSGETFTEDEISEIELLVVKLVKSEHLLKDLQDIEKGKLNLLGRFLTIVGVKNAQDAKRGYGGMMAKTIFLIARIRGTTPHDVIKSFFNHADGDSIEELRERIYSVIREAAGEIPELGDIEVLLSSKSALDPYAVADSFGEVKGGAVWRDTDWDGGTGNRPVGTKRASHSLLVELPRLDALTNDMLGLMTLNWVSSCRTPVDALRNILIGNVDGIPLATALMHAMGCVSGKCRACHTGRCVGSCLMTDQAPKSRAVLRVFDPTAPEDHDHSGKTNAKVQKERAKRFLLAFIRTMKVLLKNVDAQNIPEAKGKRECLAVNEDIQIEGAEWIHKVEDSPYSAGDIQYACNVSRRLNVRKLIEKKPFPAQETADMLRQYLRLPSEGVPNELASRNAFLVLGDIANAFPRLSNAERRTYMVFFRKALARMEESYRIFLREHEKPIPSLWTRDALLTRYHRLDTLKDRDEQEFLERLITGYRILELCQKFHDDENEQAFVDEFFQRTSHRKHTKRSIKSPRAIVSQQNAFTIDRYRGVQRKVAAKIIEHLKAEGGKEPLLIEIDDSLTDRDMGILSSLNALFHHFPERFARRVERIELRLNKGVTGHNLGALVNGNYLFGKDGPLKIRIIVGSFEAPAHGDGSVGMSANGLTVEVAGCIGDCGGAYASDLSLRCLAASVKFGMGARGDTVLYSHRPLPDVTGIGMTGNATIVTAGVQPRDETRKRAAARPGIGGDIQGLAKICVPMTVQAMRRSQIPGKGSFAKRFSRLDEIQVRKVLSENYPFYEDGQSPADMVPEDWSKIVSKQYYRNIVTSIIVFDFFKMREDFSYEDQLESAVGELLEMMDMNDRAEEIKQALHRLHEDFTREYSAEVKVDDKERGVSRNTTLWKKDPDTAFKDVARVRALQFLSELKASIITS